MSNVKWTTHRLALNSSFIQLVVAPRVASSSNSRRSTSSTSPVNHRRYIHAVTQCHYGIQKHNARRLNGAGSLGLQSTTSNPVPPGLEPVPNRRGPPANLIVSSCFCCHNAKQAAQLSQMDRSTCYVRWNLVNCWTTVQRIAFERPTVG